MSPSGPASPSFKTGRWSKDLPTRLGAKLHEYMQDGNPHDLEAEIALIDLGIGDLVTKLDSGESASAWERAQKSYKELMKAIGEQDQISMQYSLRELGGVLEDGTEQIKLWNQIKTMTDQKRRIVESNRKAVKEREETLDRRQQIVLMAAIADAVGRCFTDMSQKRQFAIELEAILDAE